MRSQIVAAIVLLVAAAAPAQQKLAPVDEAGMQKLLAANKGKVLLVNFWATWCVPCREEMPALVSLERKFASKGFKLALISADEREQEADARKFLQSKNAAFPAYLKQAKNDDKFINAIDPKWSGALPATFIYDRAGKKVKSFIGEADMTAVEASLKKALQAL